MHAGDLRALLESLGRLARDAEERYQCEWGWWLAGGMGAALGLGRKEVCMMHCATSRGAALSAALLDRCRPTPALLLPLRWPTPALPYCAAPSPPAPAAPTTHSRISGVRC